MHCAEIAMQFGLALRNAAGRVSILGSSVCDLPLSAQIRILNPPMDHSLWVRDIVKFRLRPKLPWRIQKFGIRGAEGYRGGV